MKRINLFLFASLLGCVVVLTAADTAQAQYLRGRNVPNRRILPGSDWWRIYPWSRYNYGRNPYNPIILPYPYPTPYPAPYPYPNPVYTQSNYTPYESGQLDGPDGGLRIRCLAGSTTTNEFRKSCSLYSVRTRASSSCTALSVEGDNLR